jgi:adenosylhomocysteine nucleosidase
MTLGVVTGLQSEAKLVAGLPLRVISGGGQAEVTRRKIDTLIAQGVRGLISFGIAGGLDPALHTGDLVISATVVDAEGQHYAGSPAWLEQALGLLPSCAAGHVYAGDRIVETTAEKHRLFTTCNALAADMESHHMARAAERHGLPFLVIRAVSDTARETLPAGLAAGVDADGGTRILPILAGLATGRLGLAAVMQAGRSASKAFQALKQTRPLLQQLSA